jgi:hypothetical protein
VYGTFPGYARPWVQSLTPNAHTHTQKKKREKAKDRRRKRKRRKIWIPYQRRYTDRK